MVETNGVPYSLPNFAIDEHRPLRVVVIGAGFSGIIAGIRIPQKLKNIDLTIYDKHAGVGGTWYANRYPGLACDIPAHCVRRPPLMPLPYSPAFRAVPINIRGEREYLERLTALSRSNLAIRRNGPNSTHLAPRFAPTWKASSRNTSS